MSRLKARIARQGNNIMSKAIDLIGANGSGKSNFVSFFSLLKNMIEGNLQLAVNKSGGADALLFMGPKITKEIVGELKFGNNGYEFTLTPTRDNRLIFKEERIIYDGREGPTFPVNRSIGKGHSESVLKEQLREGNDNRFVSEYIYDAMSRWVVYHFHDTSETAGMRRPVTVRDYENLRPDAGNIAAFLRKIFEERNEVYELIRNTIRLVAPFFDDFKLRPQKNGQDEVVQLEWVQKGSDYPFHPSQLSDGTIRFICLATALLQPNPPATILLDEPELGLHPDALNTLAGLIKQAATKTQVIVATQSAPLLDHFKPKDVVVLDRNKGQTRFHRLDPKDLHEWLNDYSLGEIWQKNLFEGGPNHE
jgi:predicted ATPase